MRMTKSVYGASWTKLDTGGKVYGRNNHSYHRSQGRSETSRLGSSDRSGINPKTYYYHLRKLREKCVASAPAIVPLGVRKYTSGIHIEKDGLQISLPTDISAETLIALVHELC